MLKGWKRCQFPFCDKQLTPFVTSLPELTSLYPKHCAMISCRPIHLRASLYRAFLLFLKCFNPGYTCIGRTHNTISDVSNIGMLEIVIYFCAHFVSAFEHITWTSPPNVGLEESLPITRLSFNCYTECSTYFLMSFWSPS